MENQNRARAEMTLSVAIERNFQDVKISYGLSGVYSIASMADLNDAYAELRTQLENQHELAMKNRPALMPMGLKSTNTANSTIMLATAVRKEFVDKKIRIRLIGGEYSTHGVAVYPEFMEALRIDPTVLEFGDTPYSYPVLVQLDNSGNPKRAVSIVESQP
jgi:hypothetical protein